MLAGDVHIRLKKKKPTMPADRHALSAPRELPPSYDEALMLPEREETDSSLVSDTSTSVALSSTDPLKADSSQWQHRLPAERESVTIIASKPTLVRLDSTKEEEIEPVDSEDNSADDHTCDLRDDKNDDGDAQAYADDDLAFETYEGDNSAQCETHSTEWRATRPDVTAIEVPSIDPQGEAVDGPEAGASGDWEREAEMESHGVRSGACAQQHSATGSAASACVYDDSTYTIASRLRAVNKRLAAELEKQTRLVSTLQEEKKRHLQLLDTLHADLEMHKRTLRSVQLHSRRPHTTDGASPPSHASDRTSPRLPHVVAVAPRDAGPGSSSRGGASLSPTLSSPRQSVGRHGDASGIVRALEDQHAEARVSALRIPSHPLPATSPTSTRPRGVSPRSLAAHSPNSQAQARATDWSSSSNNVSALQQLREKYAAKLEKAEQGKKDAQTRHCHQLANYSHELSRLERQLEHAHKATQEKENELRLQKIRQLYAHGAAGGGATTHDHRGGVAYPRGLLADDFWTNLAPSNTSSSSLSTHIGRAFEQLLTRQTVSVHDHALDASTREWLSELRACGAQLLQLHQSFQGLSGSFQRLAESSHLYQLAETLARETRALVQAEQALVFVTDPTEQEFWCRVPRTADASDMITVRSTLMPFTTVCRGSHAHQSTAQAASAPMSLSLSPLLGDSRQVAIPPQLVPSGRLPCGLASMVYHTRKPLLIPAGAAAKHPCYSTASDNTDRLVRRPSASTLLLPLEHAGEVLGVLQVSGKLAIVAALGLSIALEKSDAFTREDQALLELLTHFAGGLFPKVAYFTEVESNKVNEETLIHLAPEIFTCLRFEELGKIVIENAKEILDADRCSLFVADNTERTLHSWQSDISGGAVQVYDSVKRQGMTIPFGHGIVGLVAETAQAINIPDAYADPRFNSTWDKKTNYRTKSMLAVPILTNTTKRQPIRRVSRANGDKFTVTEPSLSSPLDDASTESVLLGVVQVINKSGGAPFRAKDEFLLRTISKLIALAIENSQLFQKNQELCANVGTLIARADLVEALICLGAAAEDIIGVESAAVYVYDPVAQEMVTFHRKRRHKTVLKEPTYRSSLFGDAVRAKDMLIVNDVTAAPSFNAYVDSIGGATVRNALFAPLVVEDPDTLGLGLDSGSMKLVGLLHLVNTKGRKVRFERHDLFLAIVSSLCCSVVASILEKRVMLKQTEQTTLLLDTSMSFFREMSPIGVINAVYNACTHIFAVEKAHLFLWEPDRRHMWTSKLLPHAEANAPAASSSSLPSMNTSDESGQRTPALSAHLRRISVLTDQKLKVPTTEGLLEQVLVRGTVVLVNHWVDDADADKEATEDARTQPGRSYAHQHALRISASDDKFGFVKHSVVACPVWDSVGLEVVGVLVLLFPRGRTPQLSELSNLPILGRQISGALNVCCDLSAVTTRSRTLQSMLEMSMKKPPVAMSLTLSARGHLVTFSQPVNLCTTGFSVGVLAACVHASTALNLHVRSLPMDEEGHRWGFQLSAATMHDMNAEHYVKWIGKGVVASEAFDKFRTDVQSVYVRKEAVTGEIDRRAAFKSGVGVGGTGTDINNDSSAYGDRYRSTTLPPSLPKSVIFELRKLLWDFVDSSWRVDTRKASDMFDTVDPTRQRRVARQQLVHVLSTSGRSVRLEPSEWDLLHTLFADPHSGLVDVERMFEALAPELRVVPHVAYEIVPILDVITQTVVSVHVVLTAL